MNKVSLLIINLLIIGCASTGEGYMQQDELLAQIKTAKAPVIVDVRSESEYQSGHVPGAIHIPFWAAFTTDKMEEYNKNEAVILYCAHGPRAGIAKLAFSLSGFENISYLAGHMTAWNKAGLAVE